MYNLVREGDFVIVALVAFEDDLPNGPYAESISWSMGGATCNIYLSGCGGMCDEMWQMVKGKLEEDLQKQREADRAKPVDKYNKTEISSWELTLLSASFRGAPIDMSSAASAGRYELSIHKKLDYAYKPGTMGGCCSIQ